DTDTDTDTDTVSNTNNDTDNDDNGIQTAAMGAITSPVFTLSVGNEPSTSTGEPLTPGQDGGDASARDMSTNTTVDFGFQDVELPVELLAFQAKADKDHIDIIWSTASEIDNSHFLLERSEDGKAFKQIARIQGQGTTLEQTDYAYEDHEAIPNVLYYYRLKQVDIDGAFDYSEIRTAQLESTNKDWELYPNPIGQDKLLNVNFYAESTTVEFVVLNVQNRSILNIKQDLSATGWTQIQIDVTVLPAGTYILMDKTGNTKQFIVAVE
ncbi:MAG: T9SS type A sorting domain-containing protein, partial [Bacteroidota bacterium]